MAGSAVDVHGLLHYGGIMDPLCGVGMAALTVGQQLYIDLVTQLWR